MNKVADTATSERLPTEPRKVEGNGTVVGAQVSANGTLQIKTRKTEKDKKSLY